MVSEASTPVADRTAALLGEVMARRDVARTISASESLTDAGVSSLDMVNLMLAIEAEFDIFIPPTFVNPKTFRSISSIAEMVEVVKAQAGRN